MSDFELARFVQDADGDEVRTAVDICRRVDAAEKARLDEAHATLRSFGAGWSHNRVVGAAHSLIAALKRASESTSASGLINAADEASVEQAFRHLLRMTRQRVKEIDAATRKGPGAEPLEELGNALAEAIGDDTGTHRLLDMEQSEQRQLTRLTRSPDEDVVRCLVRYQNRSVNSEHEPVDAIDLVVEALGELSRVAAAEMVSRKAEIEQSSRTLFAYQAEVIYGAPTIVVREPAARAAGKSFGLGQEPIELNTIYPVMIALRRAENLLGAADRDDLPGPAPDAADKAPDSRRSKPSAGSPRAEQDESAQGPSDEVQTAADELEPDKPAPLAALDLPALLLHVGTLCDEVERAWSDAVAPNRDQTFDVLRARWHSALVALQERVSVRTKEITERGLADTIPEFPPTARTISLEELSDPDRLLIRLQISELHVLHELVRGLAGLDRPSEVAIDVVTGEMQSWWEAGAFSRLRELSHVLARIGRTIDETTGDHSPSSADMAWREALNDAARAIAHGDYPAALIYLARSLQSVVGARHSHVDDDEDSAWARAFEVSELRPLADVANELVDTAIKVVRNESVSLGAIVSLSYFWANQLATWATHGIPEGILTSKDSDEADEGDDEQVGNQSGD